MANPYFSSLLNDPVALEQILKSRAARRAEPQERSMRQATIDLDRQRLDPAAIMERKRMEEMGSLHAGMDPLSDEYRRVQQEHERQIALNRSLGTGMGQLDPEYLKNKLAAQIAESRAKFDPSITSAEVTHRGALGLQKARDEAASATARQEALYGGGAQNPRLGFEGRMTDELARRSGLVEGARQEQMGGPGRPRGLGAQLAQAAGYALENQGNQTRSQQMMGDTGTGVDKLTQQLRDKETESVAAEFAKSGNQQGLAFLALDPRTRDAIGEELVKGTYRRRLQQRQIQQGSNIPDWLAYPGGR